MNHRPRKRYGQHFLHDRHVIQRIVQAIAPEEPAPIVEIGPGKGALTIPLLQSKGILDVIEIDRDLAEYLAAACRDHGRLNLHVMDALKFDFCSIGNQRLKVTGNLPYNISTPLLFHLLDQVHCIACMVFMLQKEVVERICAAPDCRDYGRLSVMIQSQCQVKKLFTIAPDAFTPPPKVESSIVSLVPLSDAAFQIRDRRIFAQIVKQAFSQRRKMVRNSLRGLVDEATLTSAGINLSSRAENLSVADYTRLANYLHDTHN